MDTDTGVNGEHGKYKNFFACFVKLNGKLHEYLGDVTYFVC